MQIWELVAAGEALRERADEIRLQVVEPEYLELRRDVAEQIRDRAAQVEMWAGLAKHVGVQPQMVVGTLEFLEYAGIRGRISVAAE